MRRKPKNKAQLEQGNHVSLIFKRSLNCWRIDGFVGVFTNLVDVDAREDGQRRCRASVGNGGKLKEREFNHHVGHEIRSS